MARVPAPTIIQKPAHPNNYGRGRAGSGLNGQLTHHHIVGSADSAVATFQNPYRQASSTFIVTNRPGVVYQCVSINNTSWADGNAASNARAITVEHHGTWLNGYYDANVVENSAWLLAWLRDQGLVSHTRKHREVSLIATQCCGDLPEQKIWDRSTQIIEKYKKQGTTTPAPKPATSNITWKKHAKTVKYRLKRNASLWAFDRKDWNMKAVETFKKGHIVEVYGEGYNKALKATYFVTKYSFDKKIANGFNQADLEKVPAPKPPAKPEWEKNLQPIKAQKLTVLVKQTKIVHLESGDTIKNLGSGTQVDVLAKTKFKGVEYYLSSYSVENGMPNGIPVTDLGIPAKPPVNEKPEWLKNWVDIADVDMYARADTDLVNLENGDTLKVIKRGEKVRIASTTAWYGHKYAITEYSTERNQGRGIRIDDLDMKPVDTAPPAPAPEQPLPGDTIDWTARAVRLLLDKFGIKHPN
jgi:hypothetical protein